MEIAAANKGAVYVVKREDRGGAGRTFESHVSSQKFQRYYWCNHGDENDDPLKKREKSLGFFDRERGSIRVKV